MWTAEVEPKWLLAEITDRRESEYVVWPSGLTAVTEYVPPARLTG